MTFTPFGGLRNCGFCKYLIYNFKLNNTMNKKTFYEAPEAELLNVRFEGNFCATEYTQGGGGEYKDEEINDLGTY